METIGTLYHWSPSERRDQILREGLMLYAPPAVSSTFNEVTGMEVVGWPYLCMGPTPSRAWGLSGDMDWTTEIEEWDLWQVTLSQHDEVHVRSDWGPHIHEIRVHNAIPVDRVWWVGQRTPPAAREA